MKRIVLHVVIVGIISVIFATGCSTDKYGRRSKAENYEQYRYKVNLNFMDEEMLIDRFGEINNPFIPPRSFLDWKDIVTFELTIENSSTGGLTLQMPLTTVSLVTSNKIFYARNQFRFSQFWENYPDTDDATARKRGTARKMHYVIYENVFENVTILKSGESKSSMLVFMGKIQKWGEVELHIPLFNEKDEFIVEHVEKYEY